ncbi:MAG: hypothetical protein PHW92_10440 [Lutibacter sp.]|nr:hypothetical protein [Lutibacter sp.]
MKNKSKEITGINQETVKIHKEIRSVYEGQKIDKIAAYNAIEKDLNLKIMEITIIIKDKYPELLEYLNEMPVSIPAEKNPDITLKNLNNYYDSLNSVFTKYKLEHS